MHFALFLCALAAWPVAYAQTTSNTKFSTVTTTGKIPSPTQPTVADRHSAFGTVVGQWVTENQWTGNEGSQNLPVLLIPTVNTSSTIADSPVRVQLAAGYFEVDTIYSTGSNFLRNTTVSLMIPLWGTTNLSGPFDIPLSPPVDIPVSIPGTQINGTITFFLDPTTKSEILMAWKVYTPFSGRLDERGLSVFPQLINSHFTQAQLQGIRHFTEAELKTLSSPPTPFTFDSAFSAPTPEQMLLQEFITNFVEGNSSTVAIQTYGPSSNQYTVDVSFLNSVLEITGNIDPKTLVGSLDIFGKFPLAGRVHLTKMEGNLISRLVAIINERLATGSVTIWADNPTGLYDLYIEASLQFQFLGMFDTFGPYKILTLPF
ncbi:hypothetical protein MIND_01320900 [Mycena indigotica]|uniref:Uncharacterized protein n=1 Tax=Mycena indigotica TaxID=2126181 RepID=A0A8H6VWI5_9AGAR|nr:uncharacterized protein MIND_01320900 [Mycena indigotica]KAF7290799.1 hypothetical protein MIND_01320900 [Mycena indigotica]